jgi:hypothetical protein
MAKHIHIVACSPRSGTSLLQELMTTCFRIDDFCAHERSIFRTAGMHGGVVCTKNPREVPYMPWTLRLNPDLYVIYVLRDPRSVIVSRHKQFPDQYYSNLRVWREFESYRRRLEGHKRFLVVKYEELVTAPDAVQENIKLLLPFLEERCAFSEFHRHARPSERTARALNGLRPVAADRLLEWQKHLPRVKAQLQRFGDVSTELVALGYESDPKWEDQLGDVEPMYVDSVLDKTWRSMSTFKMQYRVFRKVLVYAVERLLHRQDKRG